MPGKAQSRACILEEAAESRLGSGVDLARVSGDREASNEKRGDDKGGGVQDKGGICANDGDQPPAMADAMICTSRAVDQAMELAANRCSGVVRDGITACIVGLKKAFPAARPAATR